MNKRQDTLTSVLHWHVRTLLVCSLVVGLGLQQCPTQPEHQPVAGPDTTSHRFTWTVDTLGGPGSSLSDVAVLSPDDIWVVGQIILPDPDSSWNGLGYENFNAAHWDGESWDVLHVPAVTSWGSITRGPIHAVFATAPGNIWMFSDAGSYARWNGAEWESAFVPEHRGTITDIWGTSASNLFFVGGNGSVTHFDGQTFTQQASGTTLPLRNVWGTADGTHIWAVGYSKDYPDVGSVLLTAVPGGWQTKYAVDRSTDSLGYMKYGCVADDTLYVTTTSGVWKESVTTGEGIRIPPEVLGSGEWGLGTIHGTAHNNIFVYTADMRLLHYNGGTWQRVFDFQQYGNRIFYYGDFRVTDDEIVLVGTTFQRLYIFRGKHH